MQNTDYEFTLPRGFVDEAGKLHNVGVMRLATTLDEIAPVIRCSSSSQRGLSGNIVACQGGHPFGRLLTRSGGAARAFIRCRLCVFARFVHSNQLWGWQFTSPESRFDRNRMSKLPRQIFTGFVHAELLAHLTDWSLSSRNVQQNQKHSLNWQKLGV